MGGALVSWWWSPLIGIVMVALGVYLATRPASPPLFAPRGDATVLYQYQDSPFCRKVRLALNVKGEPFTCVNLGIKDSQTVAAEVPASYGRLPVLRWRGKDVVCDSTNI